MMWRCVPVESGRSKPMGQPERKNVVTSREQHKMPAK